MSRMFSQKGFTLIEVLAFIVVSSLLMTTIFLASTTALNRIPAVNRQWVALQAASSCMEWFLQQRRVNGYSTLTCPSTPSATLCTAPAGYSVAASVACTTWNSDTTYKTITITVSGLGNASISTQIGDY